MRKWRLTHVWTVFGSDLLFWQKNLVVGEKLKLVKKFLPKRLIDCARKFEFHISKSIFHIPHLKSSGVAFDQDEARSHALNF